MIKKIDGDLLTKSINHKLLVEVRLFATAKATDMNEHLKLSLRDFNPGLEDRKSCRICEKNPA